MSQDLRPYQDAALAALSLGFARGCRRQVLVLPTGAGKTTVAAHMIRRALAKVSRQNAVLFVAHRTELIDQCSARLDANGIDAHGVIMASHPRHRPFAPVQVASIDTLAVRPTLSPAPLLIVADECHRAVGARQARVICDLYANAATVGLTATPWRLDGRGLGRVFDTLVIGSSYAELIRDGYILDPVVYAPWRPSLRGVAVDESGDYDAEALARVVNRAQTIADMVAVWQARAGGARTVAFAASIEHSRHIVAAFNSAGVIAEHVDGTTPGEERAAILARLARGETTLVSNYGVLTEGWDCPSVEVCILARPTKSLALYMQCVGRVLRPSTGTGKARALVLDFAGCVLDHGWPTADRDWSLADRDAQGPKRQGGGEDGEDLQIAICPACFAARLDRGAACPECGHVERGPAPDLVTRSGVPLVEVTRDAVATRARLTRARRGPRRFHGRWRAGA